ncbi:SRPBCC family protein [Oceaniglobus roseus]|uniref:SRPBCC family protein n=1 Tax=Oceaniglobus roseus TaxID=1737570 RepID=UPI000C7F5B5F|nr:SRPBCC family protein [Kandeliimicrobium roseum]
MKFNSRQDIGAPIAEVFAAVSNFETFELQMLRRGIEVVRLDDGADPAKAAWRIAFDFRGRQRQMAARVVRYEPATGHTLSGHTDGLNVEIVTELIELSKSRTRLLVSCELLPQSITARLLVQSLKLAKGNLARRFDARLETFAREIERKHDRKA